MGASVLLCLGYDWGLTPGLEHLEVHTEHIVLSFIVELKDKFTQKINWVGRISVDHKTFSGASHQTRNSAFF